MKKATYSSGYFEEGDSFPKQGTEQSVKHYKKDGYIVKELGNGNGNWNIIKPSKFIATFDVDGEQKKINIKQPILNYYGRQRFTESLSEKFIKDQSNGKLNFSVDALDNIEINENKDTHLKKIKIKKCKDE